MQENIFEGRVVRTIVYPVKGIRGVDVYQRGIQTDTNLGVVGDRNFAVFKKAKPPTTWKPKGQFRVCMNTPGMANLDGFTEAQLDENYRPDPGEVRGLLRKHYLLRDGASLVDTGGAYRQADTDKACVSFLNLASLRRLQDAIGRAIDPMRFRMNVWVDGLPPWCELDYVEGFEQGEKYPMWAGGPLQIDDLCERCDAINQNPLTGDFDLNLMRKLGGYLKQRDYQGSPQRQVHTVMGWLAIPQENFTIRVGDAVRFSRT